LKVDKKEEEEEEEMEEEEEEEGEQLTKVRAEEPFFRANTLKTGGDGFFFVRMGSLELWPRQKKEALKIFFPFPKMQTSAKLRKR
jgi:hypothetical protein